MKTDRELLRELIPVNQLWKRLQPRLHRNTSQDYSVACPFHRDHKPSLRIYQQRNRARCFGTCNKTFDVVDLVAESTSVSQTEAIRWLIGTFELDLAAIHRVRSLANYDEPTRTNPDEIYAQGQVTDDLRDYLRRTRKIDPRLISHHGLLEHQDRILFPHYLDGLLYAVSSRSLWDRQEPKFLDWIGPLGDVPFGIDRIDFHYPMAVCEAQLDALSLQTIGIQSVSIHLADLSERTTSLISRAPFVLIATDGDQRGREGAIALESRLITHHLTLPTPEGQDMNSLLVSGELVPFIETFIRLPR